MAREHEKSLNIGGQITDEQIKAATDPVSPRRFGLPRICPHCLLERAKCACPEQCCKPEK